MTEILILLLVEYKMLKSNRKSVEIMMDTEYLKFFENLELR